jgi:hypothetical protein
MFKSVSLALLAALVQA